MYYKKQYIIWELVKLYPHIHNFIANYTFFYCREPLFGGTEDITKILVYAKHAVCQTYTPESWEPLLK